MLMSTKGVIGTKLEGGDGYLGSIEDLLFDDLSWRVRYLVIDTGKWLPGRKVILHPEDLARPDWTEERVEVQRTRQEIEESPPIGEHEPVSKQHERQLHEHFLWGHVGRTGPAVPTSLTSVGGAPSAAAAVATETIEEEPGGDPHLRSVDEVVGYHISASDGEIGHLEELILDDENDWTVRYLVVDTRNWLPGRKVLVAVGWSSEIRWEDRKIEVSLARDLIEESPEFDASQPVNRRYEQRLYDYYGRPTYWNAED